MVELFDKHILTMDKSIQHPSISHNDFNKISETMKLRLQNYMNLIDKHTSLLSIYIGSRVKIFGLLAAILNTGISDSSYARESYLLYSYILEAFVLYVRIKMLEKQVDYAIEYSEPDY